MQLDVAKAEKAVARLADELSMEAMALADGIVQVVNAKMAQAIRTITVERGIEPGDFSIVAFGGAGPMHAVALADELGVPEVIVPPYPGAFSAWGMLQSAVRQDFSHPFFRNLSGLTSADVTDVFATLGTEARASFDAEGISSEETSMRYEGDLRYVGQEHTLTMPIDIDSGDVDRALIDMSESFHTVYEKRYGHANRDADLEFVNLRLTALGDVGRPLLAKGSPPEATAALDETTQAMFEGRWYETKRLARSSLVAGTSVAGPLIVEEETATTIIPPRWTLTLNEYRCLVISAEAP